MVMVNILVFRTDIQDNSIEINMVDMAHTLDNVNLFTSVGLSQRVALTYNTFEYNFLKKDTTKKNTQI